MGHPIMFKCPETGMRVQHWLTAEPNAPEGAHIRVPCILSERSREIIRLFEERQRKRQQVEQDPRLHSFSQLPGKS